MTSHDPTSGGADEREEAQLVAALERFGTTLRGAAVWEQPPADLGDRIVADIAGLRDEGPPVSLDAARQRRANRWLGPAVGVAAAAVVAFAAGLLIGNRDDGGADAIGDIELTGRATASGDVVADEAGYEYTLDIEGLPPAPDEMYYEGWVCDIECTTWVSIGTFHMRGGDGSVVLWSGVLVADFPNVRVTSEVVGDPERGDIVLEGQVTRR